ncbi:MAG: P1 family peptidase [Gemmatimonadetes bacterium]|nr:P1 family peptidase [Gemmatimonadota bacterium]MCY3679355.1 P1 family peptidase [Gemmatimonadota bacterium]
MLLLACAAVPASAQKPRARDLGVPFEGTPGSLNAITDVAGVEVGHATIVRGRGRLVIGEGPVRTGVTAVWPRGREEPDPVYAAWFTLNGDGEMTGTTWVRDSGIMEGPVMITNTLSVGVVHHAVIRWGVAKGVERGPGPWLAALPVVGETWDGTLNDIRGQHVTEEDALAAMDAARGGPVAEGNVGGGTGMICHRFKGGIGTSSRVVRVDRQRYTVGVLVQCNYGSRELFRVAGVPVGREIADLMPERPGGEQLEGVEGEADRDGSIIVVVATDAPVLPHQLERMARRVSLGLARNGSIASNGSGDIFVAFSTANREAAAERATSADARVLANGRLNPLFTGTVEATEEAIINALIAAETMTGTNDVTVHALPHDRLREVLRKYNRLEG